MLQSETFLVLCLAGKAVASDVDTYVDRWHEGQAPDTSLADYLGFSPAEYAFWVEKPSAIPYIILAHQLGEMIDRQVVSPGDSVREKGE